MTTETMLPQTGPELRLDAVQAAEARLLVPTYERSPHLFVRGYGATLVDEKGEAYLDLLSGIGCSALGYGHPALTAAIVNQAQTLLHTSNLFFHSNTVPLAELLVDISGFDRVFFTNSGTEAWEAALKITRAYATARREQGKRIGTRFLALEHSFHGRTMGSVATTHKAKYREPFAPVMPDVAFVRFNDVAHLEELFSEEICGICVEPIQGEGGIHEVSPEFFAKARELCDSTGALLLADEIQCGMGRTGRWFAFEHFAQRPDVVTLAKPLAGGLPIGCLLCTERVADAFTPGMHGTTFGGGPLVTAAARAVIETIQRDDLLAHVASVGAYFQDRLAALQARHPAQIMDVRGRGLMLGVEMVTPELAKELAATMLERRIILNRTSETVLRFLPPYILQRAEVDQAVDALDELLTQTGSLDQRTATAPGDNFHE